MCPWPWSAKWAAKCNCSGFWGFYLVLGGLCRPVLSPSCLCFNPSQNAILYSFVCLLIIARWDKNEHVRCWISKEFNVYLSGCAQEQLPLFSTISSKRGHGLVQAQTGCRRSLHSSQEYLRCCSCQSRTCTLTHRVTPISSGQKPLFFTQQEREMRVHGELQEYIDSFIPCMW